MSIITDESKEAALKEGVSVDEAPKEDAKKEEVSSTPTQSQAQPNGAAKSVETDQDKFRQQSFKQAAEWKRKYEDLEDRFSKLESTYTNKLESLVGMMSPRQEANLSPEDTQLLIQLFQKGLQVPQVAEMLGLNKSKELEQSLQEERETRLNMQFDNEFDSVINKWSASYGLKADEMKQELLDYMSTNEFYGKKSYTPGLIAEAAKSLYFDRLSELKERQTNLSLIREQQEKKKSGTEAPSKGKPGKGANIESSMKDFLARRIQEEGGLAID